MAYQVVKTIKGKKYLYSQSTYREGGKVKTISHYLGAVDSATGLINKPSDQIRPHDTANQVEQVLAQTPRQPAEIEARKITKNTEQILEASNHTEPASPPKTLRDFLALMAKETGMQVVDTHSNDTAKAIRETIEKPPKPPLTLKPATQKDPMPTQTKPAKKTTQVTPLPVVSFQLKASCPISLPSLSHEHRQQLKTLKQYGIDPTKFPPVTVKHGAGYSHYKPAFKKGLVITAPKRGFNRETLRTEYRKALHRVFIETLEQEAPEKFYPFQYAFDQSYRQTQDALTRYLANCNGKNSFYKILALKFFNIMSPVPTGKRTTLAPDKIGLVEYGKRADWKAEYTVIMAEIDKQGIKKLTYNAQKSIATANAEQRKTIKTPTVFFRRKRKKVRRLQARIDANKELIIKLRLIYQYKLSKNIV